MRLQHAKYKLVLLYRNFSNIFIATKIENSINFKYVRIVPSAYMQLTLHDFSQTLIYFFQPGAKKPRIRIVSVANVLREKR